MGGSRIWVYPGRGHTVEILQRRYRDTEELHPLFEPVTPPSALVPSLFPTQVKPPSEEQMETGGGGPSWPCREVPLS